jgi:hypothetical protein
MRTLVIVGMGIIALATGAAFAPSPAVRSAGADQTGLYGGPDHGGIHALRPAGQPPWQTALWQGQAPRVIRACDNPIPAIDMDNSRWIDDDMARMNKRRQERLGPYPNNTYPSGGYVYMRLPRGQRYPPGGYAYPGLPNGYNSYSGGRYYAYNNAPAGYYRDPATGLYHVNPQRTYPAYGQYQRANR